MQRERIVAVGLLTQRNLDQLGDSLERLWPVDESPCFGTLLQAIDEADRQVWRERDQVNAKHRSQTR
jgi:hypothetical protein